jgi:hypothetical protein
VVGVRIRTERELKEQLDDLRRELERATGFYRAVLSEIELGRYSPERALADLERLRFAEVPGPLGALEKFAVGEE